MPRLIKRRSKKAGFPPGTLVHIGEKKSETPKITIIDYDEASFQEKEIKTIESMGQIGKLHPIQEEFIAQGAIQCGFCTPGMILSARALLDENPNPTELEVKKAISGNFCRCTGYVRIVNAILSAAERLRGENDERI